MTLSLRILVKMSSDNDRRLAYGETLLCVYQDFYYSVYISQSHHKPPNEWY